MRQSNNVLRRPRRWHRVVLPRSTAPALRRGAAAMVAPLTVRGTPPDNQRLSRTRAHLEAIERESGARSLAVCLHDLGTPATLDYRADRWFHAASTIKVAVLAGVFSAIADGTLLPGGRVQIRNRFYSAADGSPFRVAADRDANAAVQDAIGRMLRVQELAHHMITTSSNLATNLLVDLVGVDRIQRALRGMDISGVDVRRGVEDQRAHEMGIDNRVTARGLASLLHAIASGRAFTPELSQHMLDILHDQEFRNGIPARLPRAVRVANKTGEISTMAHDAAVVYPPDRAPYVLVVLSEWDTDTGGRSATISRVSHAIYDLLTGEGDG
jgi:beta-lactamase class A